VNRQLAKDPGKPSRHNSQPAGADGAEEVDDASVVLRKTEHQPSDEGRSRPGRPVTWTHLCC